MKITLTRLAIVLAELVVGLWGAYISIFKLDGQAAMVAGFFTVVYLVLSLKLELHFSAEDDLFGRFPILHSLQRTSVDQEMISTISGYHAIHDPLLREIAKSAWRDFSSEIKSLHGSFRSENLAPSAYIEYIQRQLESIPPKTRIIAVSLYGEGEFSANSFEKNFHEAQLRAISEGGASIERIFLCSEARMRELRETPYWQDHLGTIDGRFSRREDVDAGGLKISNGFILIGSVLFDDRLQPRGLSGVVSTNSLDIERAERDFSALERYARPLSEVFR